jgi:hypothetical protein
MAELLEAHRTPWLHGGNKSLANILTIMSNYVFRFTSLQIKGPLASIVDNEIPVGTILATQPAEHCHTEPLSKSLICPFKNQRL